jgi:hypothetical protein
MLNSSSLKTDIKLTKKWIDKKVIKNKPESAMATFLAIDDFKIVGLLIIKY